MTVITPNYVQTINGQGAPVHVVATHEPLKENLQHQPAPAVLQMHVAPKKPLKVAVVGTAPSSNMLAPFNDPTWTIWVCSPGNMGKMPRVDAWFELHSNLLWPKHEHYGRPYLEWLKQQTFPVYMQDQSQVPNAIPFPMFELVKEFGKDFFTSSFAWMMAFAMKLGAVEIALYGVDMASRNEYILQRPGFYYFRTRAEERGIRISAPHESDIMQSPPLYAYVDSTPVGRKMAARREEVTDRINAMVPQRDQLNHNITYLQGAQEDVDYFESIWSGVGNEIILYQAEIASLKAQLAARAPASASTADQPPQLPAEAGAQTKMKHRRRTNRADVLIANDPHAEPIGPLVMP